jgi:large subunit ribosomal protein L2
MPLAAVPDAMPVFNVELAPRDGGRIVRSSGAGAFVLSHDEETGLVSVQLPSKKVLVLPPQCFATIGIAAGGGRLEKPLKKAGTAWHAAKARGSYYPRVRGTAMNAYDHPYGGRTGGRPTSVGRNAPPGRKAGHFSAASTGRKKAKRLQE